MVEENIKTRTHIVLTVILVVATTITILAQLSTFKTPLAFGIDIPDNERYRVIVSYKTNAPLVTHENISKRVEQLQNDRRATVSRIEASNHVDVIDSLENLPIIIVETDKEGLKELARDPNVEDVTVDRTLKIFNSAFEAIGCQFDSVTACYDGQLNYAGNADNSNSYEVVIIDTGMRRTHIVLAGKIAAEACFSVNSTDAFGNTITSMCPGGATSSTASGSSEECTISGCGHGTRVAGAAVMSPGQVSGNKISGSAPSAKVIPIKVVSQNTFSGTYNQCDGSDTTCALLYLSSIYAAMNHVITLSATRDRIASVNISAGAGSFSSVSDCKSFGSGDYNSFENAALNLKNLGIATVVASGNDGSVNQGKIAFPACTESAIAVSAADAYGDGMAYYSQNGALVDFIAPGGDVLQGKGMMLPSSSGDNLFSNTQGTSFAAPTVAGIYATLRSKYPTATVDQLTNLLKTTGKPMIDSRSGYGSLSKPFVQVDKALKAGLTEITTTKTLSGTNIIATRDTMLSTFKTQFSTPYGYTVTKGSTTLYKSGLTPYGANVSGNGFMPSASGTKVSTGVTINLYRYSVGGSDASFKTYYVVINGDTNGDGKIDITDLVQVSQHMAGVSPLTTHRFAACDINKDSKCDITDLVRISQYMAGIKEIQ